MRKIIYIKTIVTLVTFVTLLLSILFSKNAIADDCIEAVPIFAGEKSICDGLIYPENLTLEHLSLRVKVDELTQKLTITKNTCKKQLAACNKHLTQADQQLLKISNPPFYRTPMFYYFSGILTSLTAMFVISYTIN